MTDSRSSSFSGLYKLNVADRITALQLEGWLSDADANALLAGRQVVPVATADTMVENVVGVFGLPLAIAPNFIVNSIERIVPLVIEESSVVAALSAAAAMARTGGGFSATANQSLLVGQIHVVGIADSESKKAVEKLDDARDQLLDLANEVHPRLIKRGGGAREIEIRRLRLQDNSPLIVVHVLVDTCDAMGANLVNTICEAIAPTIAAISGGEIALRILSNLVDRSIVSASVRYPAALLANGGLDGATVRDRIVVANDIAVADPHRAATHNKGIMNGIDALALATGNDWRALEAGAHAYAARSGRYSSLTQWSVASNGDLVGEIELPLKAGIVGGATTSNSAAALGLAITGVESAGELAELMAAVGLAQNFSALRALATDGIQQGHMRMHARSVAAGAGAQRSQLDDVVERLLHSGEIKDWKAAEILAQLDSVNTDEPASTAVAHAAGKIILFGEHAVVYGYHALAVPIADAIRAAVTLSADSTTLSIPDWGLQTTGIDAESKGIGAMVNLVKQELSLSDANLAINVSSSLPAGMGLGASAALAVAITRAIALCMKIALTDAQVNAIAFECEKLNHGTPSGIDNTVSCFDRPVLFRKSDIDGGNTLRLDAPLPLVIGFSHHSGSTLEQVAGVRTRRQQNPQHYDAIFEHIDRLSIKAAGALAANDWGELGQMMNVCHGLLNALQVSTPEIEDMLDVARGGGALGAKLTGAGGGGSIVALCPGTEDQVRSALHRAGYATLRVNSSAGAAID